MSQDATAWFTKSTADYQSMNWEMSAEIVNYDAVVFHGQQCIEKLLKGILVSASVEFERTHDLHVLAGLVINSKRPLACDPADLAVLQPGAVLLRYPGYSATKDDAERAIAACERLRGELLRFT